jgi:hypothetical protein
VIRWQELWVPSVEMTCHPCTLLYSVYNYALSSPPFMDDKPIISLHLWPSQHARRRIRRHWIERGEAGSPLGRSLSRIRHEGNRKDGIDIHGIAARICADGDGDSDSTAKQLPSDHSQATIPSAHQKPSPPYVPNTCARVSSRFIRVPQ